ncbi:MAG TPA: sigma-70 family RNA polymerase sigma factor [Blastocatellia bacterium]|nr:sigma-70 family RNA polymerase sigma factor [Blastocatellia bacterium]
MDSFSSKTEWSLTAEAFAKFLACLDSDQEKAGEKYETIRQTLVKFFDWRGAHFPEDCADETLNRVTRKIDEGDVIQDVATYCHGVARLVFLEKLKSPDRRRTDFEELPPLAAVEPEVEEPDTRQECFNHCLRELPTDSQQILLQYYQDEKRAKINNRLTLAERLGIPLNALRNRVQRLRDKLEQCVHRCQKKNL